MKIEKVGITDIHKTPQKKPSFGNELISSGLNFLQTSPAIGATFVDMAFMCTPRTIVDFTRSPSAGIETARREFTCSINDAFLGMYGVGAAALLSSGLNAQYGTKLNNLFVDNDKLDILSDIKLKSGDLNTKEGMNKFLNEVINSTDVFSPNSEKANSHGWIKIEGNSKKRFIDELSEELLKTDNGEDSAKRIKELKQRLRSTIIYDTGVESEDFKMTREIIDSTGQKIVKTSQTSLDDYLDNVIKMVRTFQKEKVAETFKDGKSVLENTFVKNLKGLNAKITIGGVAACAGAGALIQPINMWLTKKKTGETGFVGGGEENKSFGFKVLKTLVAVSAMSAAIRTMGINTLKNFKENLLSKIQFKGKLPTINQFKFVYGITIFSRMLSSRNGNELRETTIKDTLGFANWLILGGFVSKLVALGFEKLNKGMKLVKYNKNEAGKMPKWLASEVMSREEVLQSALKKANVSTLTKDGKAMKLSELFALAKKHAPEGYRAAKILNWVQIAGYIYSGLALGIGIPKLNIAITNAVTKRKEAKNQTKET